MWQFVIQFKKHYGLRILSAFNRNVGKINIRCDSQPAVAMFKSVGIHGRSKHIDIKLQYVKQYLDKGEVEINYIPTEDNFADLLTKIKRGGQFNKLRKLIFDGCLFTKQGKVLDNMI